MIIDLAYKVLDEIKNLEEYKYLARFNDSISGELEILVEEFKSAKKKYDDIIVFGDYYPGIKEIRRNLSLKKEALYKHPLVIKYKENEAYINRLLDDLVVRLEDALFSDKKHLGVLTWLKEDL